MNTRPTMMQAREPEMDPATGEIVSHEQRGGTQMAMGTQGWIMTAQPVARERQVTKIRQKIAEACAIYGETYVYSWPVRDRKTGNKQMIEGPTVKMANDVARIWGNNVTMICRVDDEGESWVFYGAFIDLETGFNYVRPFRQRKDQSLGMPASERARETDIVFQIGASKAIRNAVVNALSGEIQYAIEQAKKALVTWVKNNLEKANEWITRMLEREAIDVKRVEAVMGRVREQWTERDLARVMAELRGVDEGYTRADDLFPRLDIAQAIVKGEQQDREKTQAEAKARAEAKVAEGAKTETKQSTGDATKSEAGGGQPEGEAAKTQKAEPSAQGAGEGGGQPAPSSPAATTEKKKGGRPPGSKNKQPDDPDLPKDLLQEKPTETKPAEAKPAETKKINPQDYDFDG